MATSIRVIEILSSQLQLGALPVGESLRILLSSEPDMASVDRNVAIVRTRSDQDVPNFNDLVYKIQDESEYGTVECSYSVIHEDIGITLVVKPDEFLEPNSNYYLIIGKGLAPVSYAVTKTVSVGPSAISIVTAEDGPSETADYEIEVLTQSNLSGGRHLVEFRVTKDSVVLDDIILDLRESNTLPLNQTISLLLNPNVPFIAGESFLVSLEQFSRLGDTKTQAFSTFLTSDTISNPEKTSTRITQDQILDFYENTTWGERASSSLDMPGQSSMIGSVYTFIHPNRIVIDLPQTVLSSSITPSSFSIITTYAFNNYMLPQMHYFDEQKKYVISYKVGQVTTDRIELIIKEDTDGLVPSGDSFIVQEL